MYLFFDNVPSNPTAEILKLKLQSPSYPGAARTEIGLKSELDRDQDSTWRFYYDPNLDPNQAVNLKGIHILLIFISESRSS